MTAAALALPISAAPAATVGYDDATRQVTYTAAGGEANAPRFNENAGLRWALLSDAVPVVAIAPGCDAGPPIVCGSDVETSSLRVTLGDGNDSGSAFSNYFVRTDVDGGSGNDDISSAGIYAYAEGGPGDDRVKLYGHQGSWGHGGSGDDAIWSLNGSYPEQYGDAGDDLIAVAAHGSTTFGEGGTGNDRLVISRADGGGARLSGDAGDDILAGQVDGGPNRFQSGAAGPFSGGSGNDVLSAPYGRNTDDGGSGDDLIDVIDSGYVAPDPEDPDSTDWGYQDTVTCGSGTDEVWADPADVVATDCEVVHRTLTHPTLPGVAQALADAAALYTN